VAGMAFAAEAISSNDLLKQVWLMAGKPGAQGRADIEAQASIIMTMAGYGCRARASAPPHWASNTRT